MRKADRLTLKIWNKRLDGETHKDIAHDLKISTKTVQRHLKRAIERKPETEASLAEIEPKGTGDPERGIPPTWSAEVEAHKGRTIDDFEWFFNRFSGHVLQPHSRQIAEAALTKRLVVINVPPRHAKSTICSVWLPIWLLAYDRDCQIIIISKTLPLALKMTRQIAWNLEKNQALVHEFGAFKGREGNWRPTSGEMIVAGRHLDVESGDYSVFARGAQQQVYGMEADWIIADDLVDISNSYTQGRREELSDWFHTELLNRRSPRGRVLVVGTRFHPGDLYGELSSKKVAVEGGQHSVWDHVNLPALSGDWETGTALWPEEWPKYSPDPERLGLWDNYVELGLAKWEQTYQQNPIPAGDVTVREEWVYGYGDHPGCLDRGRSMCESPGYDPNRWTRVVSVDPSPTQFSGWVVADLPYEWGRKVFEARVLETRSERMSVRDMVNFLRVLVERYHRIDYFLVERNIAHFFLQDAELREVLRANDIRLKEHFTSSNKNDPEFGIRSQASDWEFGRIRLPAGDPESMDNSRFLIQEAVTHPYGDRDDVLHALWFIRYNARELSPRRRTWLQAAGRVFNTPPRLNRTQTPYKQGEAKSVAELEAMYAAFVGKEVPVKAGSTNG